MELIYFFIALGIIAWGIVIWAVIDHKKQMRKA